MLSSSSIYEIKCQARKFCLEISYPLDFCSVLGDIDPNPHYEIEFYIEFYYRNQVRVGGEITDSNFIADIAVGIPCKYNLIELLNSNRNVITQII